MWQVLHKGLLELFTYKLTPCLTLLSSELGTKIQNKLHSLLLQLVPQTTDQGNQ